MNKNDIIAGNIVSSEYYFYRYSWRSIRIASSKIASHIWYGPWELYRKFKFNLQTRFPQLHRDRRETWFLQRYVLLPTLHILILSQHFALPNWHFQLDTSNMSNSQFIMSQLLLWVSNTNRSLNYQVRNNHPNVSTGNVNLAVRYENLLVRNVKFEMRCFVSRSFGVNIFNKY